MRQRRRGQRPPDLTSLFDVLFIVVFVALIRAAAFQNAAAKPPDPAPVTKPARPVPPVLPVDVATLRMRALVELDAQLAKRTPLVVRISAQNTIASVEADGKQIALDIPLVEHDPNPDIALTYLPDRSVDLRLCKVAALHLKVDDLSRYLVIVAPLRAVADLPHALHDGLFRDLDRCLADQRGLATIVDPEPTTPP
ncbi:MAG: hypothetical protein ACKV2T_04535 [Kofleriaceae bacterium]